MADFDDQLWPINCIVLILAGFVVGIVIATSEFPHLRMLDFTDPAVLMSGWVRLASVILMLAVGFWAVIWFQRWMARRVLFCVLLGLLVHLWLGVYLHEQFLVLLLEWETDVRAPLVEEPERITVPDYHWQQADQPRIRQSFEKPVQTDAPNETDLERMEKQEVEYEPSVAMPKPQSPESPDRRPPEPAEIRRAELSAPRRADQGAGNEISRQPLPHRPKPNEPIPQPEIPPIDRQSPITLESQVAAQERLQPTTSIPRRQVSEPERVAMRQADAAELTRRIEPSEPATDVPVTPAAARQLVRATAIPHAEAEAPQPIALQPSRQPVELTPAPTRSPLARQTAAPAASPAASQEIADRQLPARTTRPEAPSRLARRAAEAEGGMEADVALARRTRVARSRSGVDFLSTPIPPEDVATTAAAGSGEGPSSQPIDARATSVGRAGSVRMPAAAGSSTAGLGPTASSPGTPGPPGRAPLARVVGSQTMPSAQPGGGAPRPARRFGRSFAAGTRAEAPQVVMAQPGAGSPGKSRLDAQVSGHERQVHGPPGGLGREPMAGAVAGLSTSGASLPQASARRAAASQQQPGEADTGPVRLATLARSRGSGIDLPAAAVWAEDVATSNAGGRPGGVDHVAPEAAPTGRPRRMVLQPGGLPLETAAIEEGLSQAAPGLVAGPRRLARADEPEPILAVTSGSGPVRRTSTPRLLQGPGETIDEVSLTALVVAGEARPGKLEAPEGPEIGGPSRREGGLTVQIAAALGPGGVSYRPSAEMGIPSRRARPESEVVHAIARRFVVERSGGRPALDGRIHETPAEAFQQRAPGRRSQVAQAHGGTEGTERAVEMGLDFLARHQFPDGRWSIDRFPNGGGPEYEQAAGGQMNADTAATGLALLAFLGAGYTHVDDKHRMVVRRGLDWLAANQQPDGRLFTDQTDQTFHAQFYGHGIGAIALSEAYGMTRDPELREPAQRAIQFIIDSQHSAQGGWRYEPNRESDTSVSGWQLMALKSAQMAGLEVPVEVLDKVATWLDLAQVEEGSRYRYNPYALDNDSQREGRVPNLAMTAEGLLMRLYLGWDRNHPAMIAGADHLKQNLPAVGTSEQPARDAYYWYYATQVMFQMQGDYWTAWNGRLRPLLETSQVQTGALAGSWHPDRPITDRWAHAGGRLYVTAVDLLMLEVYYRHLPLFRTLRE